MTSDMRSNERKKKRYREDPEFRAKCLAQQKAWYDTHYEKHPRDRSKNKTLDMKEYQRRYYQEHKLQRKIRAYELEASRSNIDRCVN